MIPRRPAASCAALLAGLAWALALAPAAQLAVTGPPGAPPADGIVVEGAAAPPADDPLGLEALASLAFLRELPAARARPRERARLEPPPTRLEPTAVREWLDRHGISGAWDAPPAPRPDDPRRCAGLALPARGGLLVALRAPERLAALLDLSAGPDPHAWLFDPARGFVALPCRALARARAGPVFTGRGRLAGF